MKNVFLFALLLIVVDMHSQAPCKNGNPQTGYRIYPSGTIYDGDKRINIYRNWKNPVDPTSGKKNNIDSLNFSACGFLRMLQMLSDPKENYTGLRIHIAADDNKKLILIFVPTKGDYFDERDPDVQYEYWQIIGDYVVPIKQTSEYEKLLNNYYNDQWNVFTKNGKDYYSSQSFPQAESYQETKTLWYSIFQINSPVDPVTHQAGVIYYLQNLINDDAIDSVAVEFAAFEPTEKYNYQIDLVFNCSKQGVTTPFNFGFGRMMEVPAFWKKKLQELKISLNKSNKTGHQIRHVKFTGDSFNTGVPCPPPPCQGCSCSGS